MPLIDNLSIGGLGLVFGAATLVIAWVGTRLTGYADRLADLTGLGEAVFGAVLLGASTSLPGVVTSVTAAYDGYAPLAVSNAVGGIAAQTAFLAIVDLSYRPANLEHAAASVENLLNGALLCALLALPLMAAHAPALAWWGVHPLSLLLLLGYAYGVHMAAEAHRVPAWHPRATKETRQDIPQSVNQWEPHPVRLWLRFAAAALSVALAGYVVGRTGIALVQQTGLSQSLVGGLLTAVSTSLPELVTALAAVRLGALTLAVGGIIGGNTFDVLFIAFSDIAYRQGSIYHAMDPQSLFVICMTLLLTSILLMGLVRREKRGAGNIGFEGVLVLGIYAAGFLTLFFGF